MDCDRHWSRERLNQQMEKWREQRIKRMASRLQLHSDRPRIISTSILGCGNYKKIILQPGQMQHINESRCNQSDQRWSSNCNYFGHGKYSSIHKLDQPGHKKNQERGHSSFHQNKERKEYFSSHKSLFHKKSDSKYFSCSSITGLEVKGNKKISHMLEQKICEPIKESMLTTLSLEVNCDGSDCIISSYCMDPVGSTAVHEPAIVHNTLDSNKPEEVLDKFETFCSLNDTFTIIEGEEHFENSKELPLSIEADEDCTSGSPGNVVPCSSFAGDAILDERSIIDMNNDNHSAEQDAKFKSLRNVMFTEIGNNDDDLTLVFDVGVEKEGKCSEIAQVDELPEPVSLINPRSTDGIDNDNSETELALNYEPDIEIIEEDSAYIMCDDYTVPEHTWEEAVHSVSPLKNLKGNEEQNNETSGNENADDPLSLIKTSDEDDGTSTIIGVRHGIDQEIENLENKLANISIAYKDDSIRISECMTTPMKRERKNALLDATNIRPSSTIKYAVREIKKKVETEIIVTPVRRSVRMSSLTPLCKENVVENLEELTAEVKKKMKFIPNPALYTSD